MDEQILIASEGILYRGTAPDHPTEVWHYPRGRWVPYRYAGLQEKGWGRQITPTEARRLKKDNPTAEHFRYYDTPPWSQPSSQRPLDALVADYLRKASE